MESPVLVVVSYSAVPSQPGVERDATNKAPICTQQGVSNTGGTYQRSLIGGRCFILLAVEVPSGAMGSEAVALIKTLG
jgi:hypothetical protein